jgi:hypothetical protein
MNLINVISYTHHGTTASAHLIKAYRSASSSRKPRGQHKHTNTHTHTHTHTHTQELVPLTSANTHKQRNSIIAVEQPNAHHLQMIDTSDHIRTQANFSRPLEYALY